MVKELMSTIEPKKIDIEFFNIGANYSDYPVTSWMNSDSFGAVRSAPSSS